MGLYMKLFEKVTWKKNHCWTCQTYWLSRVDHCVKTCTAVTHWNLPPRVLLLCRSWGACVPRRPQRLCQLESWLLVGLNMLDRLCGRGQTKCNTPLMLATSAFGRISQMTLLCNVPVKVQTGHSMAQWRGMHGSVPCAFCHADTHYPVM